MLLFFSGDKFLNIGKASCAGKLGKFPMQKMSDGKQGQDSTESLIESLHASRKKRSLLINPDYLDDEKLPEDERTAVLKEIFNKNIREKQLSRIISHLAPVLDRAHPPLSTHIWPNRLWQDRFINPSAINVWESG